MHCHSVKTAILQKSGKRTGNGSWVGQPLASVTLSSRIFGKRNICLISVTEVLTPPADVPHMFLLCHLLCCCSSLEFNCSSPETILLPLHMPLYRITGQIDLVQLLSQMYCSLAMCSWVLFNLLTQ